MNHHPVLKLYRPRRQVTIKLLACMLLCIATVFLEGCPQDQIQPVQPKQPDCSGECSGEHTAFYDIVGPCPEFPPPDEQWQAAILEAESQARSNAAMNCRQRGGKNCTCAFGTMTVGDVLMDELSIPPAVPSDPPVVCAIRVSYKYEGGTCQSGRQFLDNTLGFTTHPDIICLGEVTAGGHGSEIGGNTCPTPCDPALLERAKSKAQRNAEEKTIERCQQGGGPSCIAVGGTELDIGGRCYLNAQIGEPEVCVYEYHSALVRASCADIP